MKYSDGIENTELSQGEEIIRTRSGEWYSLSKKDLVILINDTVQVMQKYIKKGDIVGLFLDFDNANLNSIIMYYVCIKCGAAIVRCGISDLERQLPISHDILLDILICTAAELPYIAKRVKHKKCYSINSIERMEGAELQTGLNMFEMFDIPGLLIFDCGGIACPGYDIMGYDNAEKEICLSSKRNLQFFHIDKYFIKVPIVCDKNENNKRDAAMSFISMQIKLKLFAVLNGKIDNNGNILLTSIGMVELLVQIEEEFCISIPLEKISNHSFENVQYLAELILSTILENKE